MKRIFVDSARLIFISLILLHGKESLAASCGVNSGTLNFGAYNPFLAGNNDSNSSFSVTCNGSVGESVSYTATLTTGSANSFSPRKMTSGGSGTLNYNLYTDSTRATIMGDGTSGTSPINDAYSLASTSSTKTHNVYGRIFALQNVPVGVYSDSLTLQVSF